MILADTSVWVDHFRSANAKLGSLLLNREVTIHTLVIGELACGNLKNRTDVLTYLHRLPRVLEADSAEVLRMIESKRLAGRGIGFIDAHLLASAMLTPCKLWTLDERLDGIASELKLTWR